VSNGRRFAIVLWLAGAIGGSVAIWWLTSYLDTLTELARTDREAALALFRSRVLPALALVVLVGVAAGLVVMRHGLMMYREARARTAGAILATAGFIVAVVPLAFLILTLWLLARA
jgi:hypothetical protein